MGKYFTIEELCDSTTARLYNIDNTPNEEITKNLLELINILDDIRENWTIYSNEKGFGKGSIIVNSGYRCDKLNTAVNSAKNSAHKYGYAVDIEPSNQHNKEFYIWLRNYMFKNEILFDELINEKPKNDIPSWIHFSIKNYKGNQRQRVFTIY